VTVERDGLRLQRFFGVSSFTFLAPTEAMAEVGKQSPVSPLQHSA